MMSFEELKKKHLLPFNLYITTPLKTSESSEEEDRERFLHADEVKIYKTDKFECFCTVPVLSKIIDNG